MLLLIKLRETYCHFVQLLLCRRSLFIGLGRFFLNWRSSHFQAKLWRLNKDAKLTHVP